MKAVQLVLAFLVALVGAVVLYVAPLGKERSVETAAVWAYGAKLRETVLSGLPALGKKSGDPSTAADPGLESALQEALAAVFLERSGYHFSRSVWGADPIPYQFRGLVVGEAQAMPVNPSDRTREVDRRVFFPLRTEAYRQYERASGWQAWQYGEVPNLEGFVFVRKRGRWQPAVAPDRYFSVR